MFRQPMKFMAALGAAGLLVSACAALPALPAFGPKTVERPLGADGKLKGYLDRADYPDGISILGPPPAPDSPQGHADRAIYEETREQAGSARWKQAVRDDTYDGPNAYKSLACAAGLTITPAAMPRTSLMMDRLGADASAVASVPKKHYQRPRPLIGNDKTICIAREEWLLGNGSYPSGHSMIGWTWALVLGELVPDKASAVLTRGREFGDSRIICGVHFQSDVVAGRTLAAAMISRLHADKAFQADLAAAKREIEAFRASGQAADCAGVTG